MTFRPLSDSARKSLESSTAAYHETLMGLRGTNHPAVEFLRERGIAPSLVAHFRLGLVVEPYSHDHEKFVGRFCIPNIIPTMDGDERVVGQKYRLLDYAGKGDKRPKFVQPVGQPARIYNLRAIAEAGDVIVVTEGESDCWSVSMTGMPAIGVPGAQVWSKDQSYRTRLLEGFSRVILCRDNDDAGLDLVKALEAVDGLEVRSFEPHKDVSEFLHAEGVDALRERINGEDGQ